MPADRRQEIRIAIDGDDTIAARGKEQRMPTASGGDVEDARATWNEVRIPLDPGGRRNRSRMQRRRDHRGRRRMFGRLLARWRDVFFAWTPSVSCAASSINQR